MYEYSPWVHPTDGGFALHPTPILLALFSLGASLASEALFLPLEFNLSCLDWWWDCPVLAPFFFMAHNWKPLQVTLQETSFGLSPGWLLGRQKLTHSLCVLGVFSRVLDPQATQWIRAMEAVDLKRSWSGWLEAALDIAFLKAQLTGLHTAQLDLLERQHRGVAGHYFNSVESCICLCCICLPT